MRLLILGATGMLGHRLAASLRANFEVSGTTREAAGRWSDFAPFRGVHLIGGVTAADPTTWTAAINDVKPDAVINCIGLIKQREAAEDPIQAIAVNALLPHQIASLCRDQRIRFIHFSTDCVFAGRGGPYREDSIPDAEDLYGRTKLLGEVTNGALTLRSSIIGREIVGHRGLLEWFLSNRGEQVKGFARALYTGLTTEAMATVVTRLLREHPDLTGLWQVASEPITKFDLLCLIDNIYGLGTKIARDETFFCDRRLDGSCFASRTGIVISDWPTLIKVMRTADEALYDTLPKLSK